MDQLIDKTLAWFMENGVGTNAGVTVTHSAVAGRKHVVEYISASGDAAGLVTIESPAGTVKWRKRFTGSFTLSEAAAPLYIGAVNTDVAVKINASTSNCEAQIGGYEITG